MDPQYPPDTYLLPRDPSSGEPLAPTSQPGYYPGYHTMSQKNFWDEATRDLVETRVEQTPSIRYFSPEQARFWRAVFDHLIPQHDRTPECRIPLVEPLDERLYQNRGVGYRFESMPQDREAFSLGEQAINEESQARYGGDFINLPQRQQNLRAAKRDALFFRACGIRRLVGVPLTEDMQRPRFEAGLSQGGTLEAEACRLVRNLHELGESRFNDPASWSLHLTPAEHARAADVLRPTAGHGLIAVSVGTKVQAKDWGREKWRALLARVAELYPECALALCGAPNESEASEFAASGWRDFSASPIVNLCGTLNPRESAAVFARAVVFLGHDSGPMHLAASVQTTCVAIFSARNMPRVWYPWGDRHRVIRHKVDCEGCNLETCIVQNTKCLTSISVDEVLVQLVGVMPEPSAIVEMR